MRLNIFCFVTACMMMPAATVMLSGPAMAQDGAGDEATLNSRRMDLEKRLTKVERAGSMSHREAMHHRRALETMVRSAKADLRRPPHFISAAENATYLRTIGDVEAALSRHRRQNRASTASGSGSL